MRDLLLSWSGLSADLVLNALGLDLDTDDTLASAVVVSLFTDRRADDSDELPAGETDPRGWCLDETLAPAPDGAPDRIGSKLWLLSREKKTPAVEAKAKRFAEDALAWIVADGMARPSAFPGRPRRGSCHLGGSSYILTACGGPGSGNLPSPHGPLMKKFSELTEAEILALAITLEEEDERVYADFAEGLRESFPATASVLEGTGAEESVHRRRLTDLYKSKFGEHIPLIRRQDVKGFVQRKPLWLMRPLGIEKVRRFAATMEMETRQFYERAAARATDADIRRLLDDLAQAERKHEANAERLAETKLSESAVEAEDAAQRRLYALQVVQPGLAGLMDGSVSTLAPVFAAAAATQDSWQAFLVGLAASLGAGISMGFAEALSDDGSMTGRGHPWIRGGACGIMTTLGGIGHTLPFLIGNYHLAITVALAVVVLELGSITWIRSHYMDTPIVSAALQVILGGVLVFLTGYFIGSA